MRNSSNHHHCYHHLWSFLISFNLLPFLSTSLDAITTTQTLTTPQTLVSSPGGFFELGFFTPGNSNKSYIGIWYKDLPQKTVVWVANRDNPLPNNSSGVLKIREDGNLVLANSEEDNGLVVWSSNNYNNKPRSSPDAAVLVALLTDSGNLILYDDNGDCLWQSFDYPTDTLLPGMKLGWDRETGLNRYLTSWKKSDDPSTGDYTFKLYINGFPECYLRNKRVIIYRSGPWNGVSFSGVPEMKPSTIDPIMSFSFKMNKDEVYYTYELMNKNNNNNESLYSRLLVNHSGFLQRYIWVSTSRVWSLFWYAKKDQCDDYAECGVYGICDANHSPVCECTKGFSPRNPQAWQLRDGSDGCVRASRLGCESDGFLSLRFMKLPDSSTAFVDPEMSLDQCREACKRNCSCRAFASSNVSAGGSGCVIWNVELVDMRRYAATEGGGQDLYVRVSSSDLEQAQLESGNHSEKMEHIGIIAGILASVAILLAAISGYMFWRRKKLQSASETKTELIRGSYERSTDLLLLSGIIPSKRDNVGENTAQEFELPLLDFSTIALATDSFSDANKLGQGGFGAVYKGVLAEGKEIAVKRLSETSVQGVEELKNEVKLIARLQHRNLVRLLGCCIDMQEKVLVYEYMENKSLDSFLFNEAKSSLLDWQKRSNIILGIARGLVYLHQDSRFRIIHRDLKASNILLDKEMNPKISDFGMARIFGGDQTEANTKRVVGTYGYMSPEYAMDGLFSVKSDVFSFGVLILETIIGKKNRGFYKTNNHLNLLAYAWRLWREGRGIELLDPAVGSVYSPSEVNRCIRVGLLCVQEQAEERPNMGTVVLMLSSETMSLPQPKLPGYCIRGLETDSPSSKVDDSCTVNQVTMTMLDGR